MSSFKVKIDGPDGTVIFQASAPVSESRSASYDQYGIVHLPTSMWAYRSTGGRKYQVQGKLVSRTEAEAGENARYLNLIRKWILPDFGNTGATPPIVYLSAYGNDNINYLQCVITSYSWSFPDDVDYIYTGSVPMPVIAMLNVDLEEIYSAEQITAGEWSILQEASGSFEDTSFGLGALGALASEASANGGGFSGIANQQTLIQAQKQSGGAFGTLGTILGAVGGKKLFGNMAGAAAGSILGNAIGTSIGQSSQLKDIFSSSTVLNNVFQTGITKATLADQTITPQEAFRNTELIAQRDDFQRSANPAPPNLVNYND